MTIPLSEWREWRDWRRAGAAFAWLLLAGGAALAGEVKLRILETTDLHMNLLDYDYYQDATTDQYGLARTATLIKAARAEAPNSLLIDNGDLLQGNPLGDVVAKIAPLKDGEVHPAYRVMNKLGYDAGNLGNHDFNYGLPFLRRAMAGAAFPLVNANVYVDDAEKAGDQAPHAFTPYVLLKRELRDADGARHPITIGVIGFVPPQIMQWDKANLDGRVVVRDIVATARRYVPEMRAKGAQLVIAVPHSGFERVIDNSAAGEGAENEVGRLARVPGIDAILFGHSHAEFPSKDFADRPNVDIARGTIAGVPAVMPGRWGDHLGVIDLTLDDSGGAWKVSASQASIRPIYDRASRRSLVAADPMVAQTIAAEHAATLAYIRGRVAATRAPIDSYFARVADDPSVQVVANAQIDYVKRALQGTAYEALPVLSAAAPFKNGGRQGWDYYTDIPAGPLAIKNVADLYMYPNTVKAVLLSGAQLREWLEMSAGQFRRIDPAGAKQQPLIDEGFPSFNFDTIDGVSYEFDVTQPARYSSRGELVAPDAHRVQDLRFRGAPVVPDARFIVATNNYRAYGGGNFPNLGAARVVLDSPDENRQVLIDHLAQAGAGGGIDPSADGNWRVRPVPGVHLTFLSGAGGIRRLERHPGVRLVKDNGDGSSLFELAD
ncbi:MAG TPA: bifunctional 2',3'-cyclic-nucleotide 2'-phosphodiesterase/3'-nucleotidase [Burkholderiaceae bacterium]|nr:bifunctional 2',3'-cyclic-nucleotide 2'-phosphodiesterase/3'-nucleotidase [Burkholderiaceae bacterium]